MITIACEEKQKSDNCLPHGKQESFKVFPLRQHSAHKLLSRLCTHQSHTGSVVRRSMVNLLPLFEPKRTKRIVETLLN